MIFVEAGEDFASSGAEIPIGKLTGSQMKCQKAEGRGKEWVRVAASDYGYSSSPLIGSKRSPV